MMSGYESLRVRYTLEIINNVIYQQQNISRESEDTSVRGRELDIVTMLLHQRFGHRVNVLWSWR